MLQCQPGYLVLLDGHVEEWRIRFATSVVTERAELADFVLMPYEFCLFAHGTAMIDAYLV